MQSRLLAAACATLWMAGARAEVAQAEIEVRVLTVLDGFEPFEAHVFHAGKLWVGRSRQDMAAFYRLEVFERDGTPLAVKELTHSARYAYPYGDDAVLLVGIGLDQLSHYTIARWARGAVQLETATIPLGALADRWAGKPGQMIFSDPGGYDDPNDPTPIGTPLQTLFSLTRNRPTWMAPRIAGPAHGLLLGSTLYLVSAPNIFSGGRTLNAIDVATQRSRVLVDGRNGIRNMISVPELNLLALAESEAGQVLLVDLKTGALGKTLVLDGGRPRALAAYGRCLLVGMEEEKKVLFYDLEATTGDKPFAEWDLAVVGDGFMKLRTLAVDPVGGRVYGRSAYACDPTLPCPDRNSVIMATPAAGDTTVARCLR